MSSLCIIIWFVGISLLASHIFFVVIGWESRRSFIINMYFTSKGVEGLGALYTVMSWSALLHFCHVQVSK